MSEEIELRHLRYFLAVAETLHFSEAARSLGMAQPPLSQQIKRLEEILGHQLFNRTTRGVRLTPAGSLLVERARSTLAKLKDDIEQVRHIGRGEEGTLTVGFAGSVIFTPLPAAIRTFRRLYPRVELRLQEMFTSGQIAALQNGTLDLAFLRDGDPTEGLTMLTLRKEPYVAILPEKHPLASKRTLQVKDLAAEPFVLFDRRMGPLAFDRTVACCERAGFRPNIIQNAPQWPTVVRLIAAGLGVSLAPACVTAVTIPGTVYRPVHTVSRTTIDVAFRRDHDTQPARNFLAIAQKHLEA